MPRWLMISYYIFSGVCIFLITAKANGDDGVPVDVERSLNERNSENKVNVLLIAVDDLNDWIGCLGGHPQALTPNMDELANRGVLFTNAHCPATACNPSRAAIFSGKWPWRTGVWNNRSKRLFSQYPDIDVFPRWLKSHGYQTAGTGKLMHSSGTANRLMFEVSYNPEQRWSPFTKESVRYLKSELPTKGSSSPAHSVSLPTGERVTLPLNRMPSDRKPTTVDGESFDWGSLPVQDGEMGDTQITDWAIDRLKLMDSEKPFLLGVGYYRPHIPLFAPAKYFDRFKNIPIALPKVQDDDLKDLQGAALGIALEAETAGLHSTVIEYKQWAKAVEAYLACTTFVDAQIGRLLQSLDRSPYAENTLIVLFSDHGWHLGEKQHWGKWTGWERSTRVPLIIVPPKNHSLGPMDLGKRCNKPVNLIDLYPTISNWCGFSPPAEVDGKSLVPLMKKVDSIASVGSSLSIFDEGNYSLRDERFRFIQYADGTEELYDLLKDPAEWTNLAGEAKLHSVLSSFRSELTRLRSSSK